jgi:hypothetical protein
MIHKRPGAKFVAKLPAQDPVVSMTAHKGQLYLATSRRVWRLRGLRWTPLLFANRGVR